ncbi:OmpA family protein [Aureibaculum sp. A20]|uniref:OmpA family protein n=1 Tax=Aureibaculum flavum TaxID=2795986 RepID=A0ABS0WWR5_9FLAO|nr:OmpA family protein [Aureibaculum flavum]MBJ2176429.1 OmpA family protein [Aureibaculum flavum]
MKKYLVIVLLLSVVCLYAQDGGGKFSINNLEVNTEQSEFGTAFHGTDKLVFAAPRRGFRVIRDVWEPNGQRFLDLYEGDISEDGSIANKRKLKGEVNSRYHEASVTFTKDGKTVYFTRDNYYNKKLGIDNQGYTNLAMFKATVNNKGEWINIIPMPFNNVEYSVGHPALSDDEKTLYFTSNMPGTLGETDIFKVEVNESGFGNPENLGPKVNSKAKDWFPFVDGDILYFSSTRSGGKGGIDIYASKLKGYITNPVNLSINSAGDDFAFIINGETRKGYFSSNREEGSKGDDDIYSFIEEEPVDFKCLQMVTGDVRDKISTSLLAGSEVILSDKDGNVIETVIVKDDATFSFEVACETEFKLEGKKIGFAPQSISFTTSNDVDKELKMPLLLGAGNMNYAGNNNNNGTQGTQGEGVDKKPEGLPDVLPDEIVRLPSGNYGVNIEPIYFDLNSSYLSKSAKTELQKVVDLMNKYPKMIIEAASHTDSRAPAGYNIWLSNNRAKRTVEYIIGRGIDYSRIAGKGYGETQLVNECDDNTPCTDAQHQQNRRSEFVIIRM